MEQTNSLKSGIDNLRRVAANATSIFTSNIMIRATSFVLYALVARYLGAFEFGQLSLGLTLFHTFHIIALAGLKTLITREVARDRTLTDKYLVNSSVMAAVFSLFTILLVYLFVQVMGYAANTGTIILLLSVGLMPYTLSQVSEGVFQAWEQMQYIAYANVPISIAKAGLGFLLLWKGYDIYTIIWLIIVSHLVILLVEWGLILKYITRPRLRLDPSFSLTMIRATAPFLGIQATIAVRSSLNIVLLSKLAGETEVGLYSAAAQLMVPLNLVFDNLIASVFPIMCRKFVAGRQELKRVTENLIELLMTIALPAAIMLFMLANSVLLFIYGDSDFLRAGAVLQILAWLPLIEALKGLFGQVLWAGQYEKVSLRIAMINTGLKFVAGLIFISQFGLIGVAYASVIVAVINFIQHYRPVSQVLPQLTVWPHLWKPIAAVAGMAIYLLLVPGQEIFVAAILSSAVYGVMLIAIMVWSAGGFYQLKHQYLSVWS